MSFWCMLVSFFFFKQKTAYEMRISDWSSDMCSSDLYPFYQIHEIPAGTYDGQDAPVTVINDPATIFISKSADEEAIYSITKTIFDNLDRLGEVHPQAGAISPDPATSTPIPLHPGAKHYFSETGNEAAMGAGPGSKVPVRNGAVKGKSV